MLKQGKGFSIHSRATLFYTQCIPNIYLQNLFVQQMAQHTISKNKTWPLRLFSDPDASDQKSILLIHRQNYQTSYLRCSLLLQSKSSKSSQSYTSFLAYVWPKSIHISGKACQQLEKVGTRFLINGMVCGLLYVAGKRYKTLKTFWLVKKQFFALVKQI